MRYLCLILVFSFHALAIGQEKPERTVVDSAKLDALPLLGNLAVSATFEPVKIDLGDHFLGDTVHGVVNVENQFSHPMTIEKMTASCGCTGAHPVDASVKPKGKTKIIVKVNLKDQGRFGGKLWMRTDLGDFLILLSANVAAKVELSPSRYLIEQDSKHVDVQFKLNDETLVSTENEYGLVGLQTRFVSLNSDTNVVKFRINLDGVTRKQTSMFNIVPVVDTHQLTPCVLTLETKGMISSVTSEIYGRDDGNELSFRLMLRGDLDSLTKVDGDADLVLKFDGEPMVVKSTIASRRAGKLLVLNVSTGASSLRDTELSHVPATMQFGQSTVSFNLNRK